MTEDIKQKVKFDELKKRYRAVEEENDLIQAKLHKAQKNIKRLRLERTVLLDRIDKGYESNYNYNGSTHSDSDTGNSDLLSLHNDLLDKHHHHQYKHSSNSKHQAGGNNATTIIKPRKKKKDPNAPKGPGNVFFLYCRMERDKIKDENPEENISDVTKLLGVKWKELPKEEKQVYYDIFKKEMEEYEVAMKIYKLNGGEDDRSHSIDPSSFAASPDTQPHQQLQPTLSNILDDDQDMEGDEIIGHFNNSNGQSLPKSTVVDNY